MRVHEIRSLRGLTQAQVAESLGVNQTGVSKIEQRDDILVSTLARLVEALGGELQIHARFPGGGVRITQFTRE